jgi:hypothetical protein
MSRPLSPAAQAVKTAAVDACWLFHPGQAAALLRAGADQVVPEEGHALPIHISSAEWIRFDERKKLRAKFLAIAAELDPPTTPPRKGGRGGG